MEVTKQRPLSPHLQVYKPQLTSILSIVHRITGVFLSLGAILLCIWLVSIAQGEAKFNIIQSYINTIYGCVILTGFVFALYYHLCNGIRHLFWDAGIGLSIKVTYQSGYLTIIVSIVLTIATFISVNIA